ncbi:MAG: AhpC/TSA family protein [Flavobacteriales bacterium]|jgi:peroxiredoxin|nr:AhpC/TSA family protein [Flavobacteriales bacterium]
MSKLAFFILLFSLSLFAKAQKPEPLFIGDKAPNFLALDQFEQRVSLKERLENGPVIVVFYRGQWCPHCNRHMSQIQDSLQMILDTGASVIAITPEKGEKIEKTMQKSGATFSIIYDESHHIMDKYHVTFKLSGWKRFIYGAAGININKASGNKDSALPVPATYIIAQDGIIFSSHFNTDYTERMSVKEMLEVLSEMR